MSLIYQSIVDGEFIPVWPAVRGEANLEEFDFCISFQVGVVFRVVLFCL